MKEFDQLYGDCDGMGLLWTNADKTTLTAGQPLPMRLFAAKNRDGGEVEERMLFHGDLMRFEPLAPEAE